MELKGDKQLATRLTLLLGGGATFIHCPIVMEHPAEREIGVGWGSTVLGPRPMGRGTSPGGSENHWNDICSFASDSGC